MTTIVNNNSSIQLVLLISSHLTSCIFLTNLIYLEEEEGDAVRNLRPI